MTDIEILFAEEAGLVLEVRTEDASSVCEMYTSSHVLCYQLGLSVRSDEVSVNPFTDCLRDVHQQSRAVLPAGAFSAFRRGEC